MFVKPNLDQKFPLILRCSNYQCYLDFNTGQFSGRVGVEASIMTSYSEGSGEGEGGKKEKVGSLFICASTKAMLLRPIKALVHTQPILHLRWACNVQPVDREPVTCQTPVNRGRLFQLF